MSLDRPSMKQDWHDDHSMPSSEYDGVQLAGDVIPLPVNMGAGMYGQAKNNDPYRTSSDRTNVSPIRKNK